ncbi:DNA primase [Proteiniclasticum sp.]|uniref:DNA primase n=1 Tax=Proteiniclasticum sp. TaxID=2053595 RepID=UPI0026009096|nr:DNA primase [Proteiniclasticum sp.]
MNALYVSEEIIEKIKDSNDILDVISETVPLKKSGRNYWGLCPFHNEKTPSFSVTQDKQLFKCFGCGEGGNVITFIMKTRNLGFNEALRILAERANIPFEESPEKKREKDRLEVFYKMHVDAARFFFQNLSNNKEVREYLYKRGIKDQTIRSFGLGYALNSWDSLLKYLRSRRYKEEDIVKCGLATKSEKGKVYDRFRNRIIFPVFDIRGRVIAFGARVLDDTKPKYLNSPETPIYNKGTHLYGLNFAKKNSKETSLIMVEGYMDLISLSQAGIQNVVASLGTALTKIQGRLLRRNSEEVYICYDADTAGQKATVRGLEILQAEGVKVKVVQISKGKDPDDYVREEGKEGFLKLLENALPLMEYKLIQEKEGLNLDSDEGRITYTKRIAEILNELDPIEKEVYLQKVSEDAGISERAIRKYMGNQNENSTLGTPYPENLTVYIEQGHVKAERSLLKILSENRSYLNERISLSDFIVPAHQKIYRILENYENGEISLQSYVLSQCDDAESSKEWTLIGQVAEIPEVDVEVLIDDFLKTINHYKGKIKQKKLQQEIKALEKAGNFEESVKLANELISLQKTLGRY